ncbi:hypothetical protein PRUPE_2G076200 [Prunus persica]|uniref:Uncharacterized protein n=1 Tax=Prunus persica TaxID=3760 RepID=A0A251QCX0_PRUPE|nr:hypothetical protein PRUPE_2G076200 [Prunus persica]
MGLERKLNNGSRRWKEKALLFPQAPLKLKQDGSPNEAVKLLKEKHMKKNLGDQGKELNKSSHKTKKVRPQIPMEPTRSPRAFVGIQLKKQQIATMLGFSSATTVLKGQAAILKTMRLLMQQIATMLGFSNVATSPKSQINFNISHLSFVCLVLLCFAMYKINCGCVTCIVICLFWLVGLSLAMSDVYFYFTFWFEK